MQDGADVMEEVFDAHAEAVDAAPSGDRVTGCLSLIRQSGFARASHAGRLESAAVGMDTDARVSREVS